MKQENNTLRHSIIALLYKLSGVDKEISEDEMRYIVQVGDHIGVDEEEISSIILNIDSFDLQIPKNERDRMSILYYLLFLMKADHKVTEEETRVIKEFAFKLGFRSTMTDEMINLVADHVNQNLSPDQLLETIKKYYN